jgi:hypothetical protein
VAAVRLHHAKMSSGSKTKDFEDSTGAGGPHDGHPMLLDSKTVIVV